MWSHSIITPFILLGGRESQPPSERSRWPARAARAARSPEGAAARPDATLGTAGACRRRRRLAQAQVTAASPTLHSLHQRGLQDACLCSGGACPSWQRGFMPDMPPPLTLLSHPRARHTPRATASFPSSAQVGAERLCQGAAGDHFLGRLGARRQRSSRGPCETLRRGPHSGAACRLVGRPTRCVPHCRPINVRTPSWWWRLRSVVARSCAVRLHVLVVARLLPLFASPCLLLLARALRSAHRLPFTDRASALVLSSLFLPTPHCPTDGSSTPRPSPSLAQFPTFTVRSQLATELGIDARQVQIWFQVSNRPAEEPNAARAGEQPLLVSWR